MQDHLNERMPHRFSRDSGVQPSPCRILVRLNGAHQAHWAEAVRLDRRGAVIRLTGTSVPLALDFGAEIVVEFDLLRGSTRRSRPLYFHASVRHVSMGRSGYQWIGVSFQKAAIGVERPLLDSAAIAARPFARQENMNP